MINLATNVMMRALTLNLNSYPKGRKSIDQFTLDQLEQLLAKIKEFIDDAYLEPCQGSERERDLALMYYFQQPDKVHCQFCRASFTEYDKAITHLTKHEESRKALAKIEPLRTTSFLELNCIPRSKENLPKTMKKFLKINGNQLIQKIDVEAQFVTNDTANSVLHSELLSVVKKKFPFARCYSFGSRYVGTAYLHSDSDIYIDLEETYPSTANNYICHSLSSTAIKESIEAVKLLMQQEATDWFVDVACLTARVPLLRVRNVKSNIKCDLTFSNGLAHRNSMWLDYMFHLQPCSRLLVCYLKQWNTENCLNSYTISLMVVFFFQCHNWLPSVCYLQSDPVHAKIIDGWNTDFSRPTLQELRFDLCGEAIPLLAQQFFMFYSMTFSLETDIVCPFLGYTGIKKSLFDGKTDKLTSELSLLFNSMGKYKSETEPKHNFAYNRPFVVQDPFELSHNVAKGIHAEKASKFLRLFYLCSKFRL